MTTVEQSRCSYDQAGERYTRYFLDLAVTAGKNWQLMDDELPNLFMVRNILSSQKGDSSAQILLDLIRAISDYLFQRAHYSELLEFCYVGIKACDQLTLNQGWLSLLRFEADNALGNWDQALVDVNQSIFISQQTDQATFAKAMLALGKFQLNRGNYREALSILSEASELLTNQQDWNGVASAKAELAAYHLNRYKLDQALELYLEADKYRQKAGEVIPSSHDLLMLGVIYRRKGEYRKAASSFGELIHRGESIGNPAMIATASHHLAWVLIQENNLVEAYHLARDARNLYIQIRDPRGESDAEEQLGVIELHQGNIQLAIRHLDASLQGRERLGNKHGVASSLRRLATAYIKRGNLILGPFYYTKSLIIYWRLGALSRQRLQSNLRELLRWTSMSKVRN